jgi:hypothetical protein
MLLLTAAWLLGLPAYAAGRESAPRLPRVDIDFFYEPGCADCLVISNQVLPLLQQRYDGGYTLRLLDTGVKSNYLELVRHLDRDGNAANESVCMVVDHRYVLSGRSAIETGLLARVDECLNARISGAGPPLASHALTPQEEDDLLAYQLRRWTLPLVVVAGLLDGINPCAISTLVFFVSLLTVARVRGRGIVLMGMSFCVAAFLTYTAIGFGLLRFLYLWTRFSALRTTVEAALVVVLAALACLSFLDAWRFCQSGRPVDVTLQLPAPLQARVHAIMKKGLSFRSLVLGGLAVGAAVTAMESVCTGQVYVPTLVLIVKSGESAWRGLNWLLLYNAMFILPLAIVFMLSYVGMQTEALVRLGRRNVVVSKVLLGTWFLALAAVVILTR